MKRIWILFFVFLLGLLPFGGCRPAEKVTAESVLGRARETMESVTSLSAALSLTMELSYDLSEVLDSEGSNAVPARMDMNMNMDVMEEPFAMHMDAALAMEAADSLQNMTYEMYAVSGNGGVTLYNTGTEGGWYTSTLDDTGSLTEFTDSVRLAAGLSGSAGDSFTLADNPQPLNGKDVYVLNGTITGSALQDMLNSIGELREALGTDFYFDGAEAEIAYSVYKDSFRPARLELEMTDFERSGAETAGITVDGVRMTYDFTSFNDLTSITPPGDVTSAAVQAENEEASFLAPFANLNPLGDQSGQSGEGDALIGTEDAAARFITATAETPNTVGGDFALTYSLASDGSYYEIGVRVTGVARGAEADEIANRYNVNGEYFSGLHENLEYGAVTYEVFVPADFPETFNGVEFYLTDPNGSYFERDYNYNDMYWVVTADTSGLYVNPGEIGTGVALFTIEKDCDDYMFEIGDSWSNETYVRVRG